MADRDREPFLADPARDRVIRQRNIVLGLVLTFFVALFFAITVVKMRHFPMPHRSAGLAASGSAAAPPAKPLSGPHDPQ